MKARITATIMLVLLLLYPLSMGPAARLTSNTKFYGSDPMAFHRLFLYLKIYRPFLGDNVLGRLMAKYTALWVPPPPFGYPTDELEAGPVFTPGL
jgi:hypothetical protein